MTIYYLYVKTHNITGLKYLGFTTQQDYHRYTGSGTRWLRHLKKHGFDYSTEILYEGIDKDELQHLGEYYSELYDVGRQKSWANLKPERGEGGAFTATPESIKKVLETKKKNGTLNTNTPENRIKAINTRHRNNTINTNTKESIAKGIYTKSKNGTLARSDECIEKMINTRKSNGTVNTRTFDNIEKQRKTILDTGNNNFIKNNPSKQKKICPYCNQETASGGSFTRWHGDNCKSKIS
jgi:hypothetical protein